MFDVGDASNRLCQGRLTQIPCVLCQVLKRKRITKIGEDKSKSVYKFLVNRYLLYLISSSHVYIGVAVAGVLALGFSESVALADVTRSCCDLTFKKKSKSEASEYL